MSNSNAEIQNLLTAEMILFMKHVLNDFDNLKNDISIMSILPTASAINYDGTLTSIICDDAFWYNIFDVIDAGIFYGCMSEYNFTLLEKTHDGVLPFITLIEDDDDDDIDNSDLVIVLFNYILCNWATQIQMPVKLWVQMEFCGISPK